MAIIMEDGIAVRVIFFYSPWYLLMTNDFIKK